ncbi:hypothetical protein MesoLj131c_16340 [Mesorhizobium sp. 131-3-5]|nr:hypothetical protein MesoLj131c_16340 [Mesorhizobium sp. 131-3-5]
MKPRLCALLIVASLAALLTSCATHPRKFNGRAVPDHKELAYSGCVRYDGYYHVCNIKMVIEASYLGPGYTAWSLDFDPSNVYWSKREDPYLFVDFMTATGGRLPVPDGQRVSAHKWNTFCQAPHQVRDGTIAVPYADFVTQVDHIIPSVSGASGPMGLC